MKGSKKMIKSKNTDYIYFIRIGGKNSRLYKIGTTNNIKKRMAQHRRYYGTDIEIIWVSPAYSKWTTLRVEARMIELWKTFEGFEYIRNDRFVIDSNIHQITIKVRKDYVIEF
jgi:predicted GIY-YIG superfamily endonuclease